MVLLMPEMDGDNSTDHGLPELGILTGEAKDGDQRLFPSEKYQLTEFIMILNGIP